ncbi:MAG: TetR family transcriptional regulator C-terminal domain-containing protein [Cyanobacteria bacterium J06621_11]
MKRTRKRDDLIRVGRDIVVRQGFNATGLSDILATASVPKGSFYYYFESKEDFGLAIIEDFSNEYQKKLEATFGNEQISPLVRLLNYFELGVEEMEKSGCQSGCLIGNLAQEMSAQSEVFRDRINQILTQWETYFANCLEAAYQRGELTNSSKVETSKVETEDLAKFIISGWQGAMLRAKVLRSTAPLQTFIKIIFEQVLGTSIPDNSTNS